MDKLLRNAFLEQVAHRVDKHEARLLPAARGVNEIIM
jgi:hypothetical protein